MPRGGTETYDISDGHFVVLKSYPQKTIEQHINNNKLMYMYI